MEEEESEDDDDDDEPESEPEPERVIRTINNLGGWAKRAEWERKREEKKKREKRKVEYRAVRLLLGDGEVCIQALLMPGIHPFVDGGSVYEGCLCCVWLWWRCCLCLRARAGFARRVRQSQCRRRRRARAVRAAAAMRRGWDRMRRESWRARLTVVGE